MEAYMRHQFSFLGIAAPEKKCTLYKKILSKSEKNKDYRLEFCRRLLGKRI